jgi:hypothetical protein
MILKKILKNYIIEHYEPALNIVILVILLILFCKYIFIITRAWDF